MGNTKLANPAPLGLMGFGMTTILLNLHNAGFFALDVIILAMGIFYGGIAQIFAGLLEYKRQHLRFNRIYLLRFVLADAGCDPADAEMGTADATNGQFWALTSVCGVCSLCSCSSVR